MMRIFSYPFCCNYLTTMFYKNSSNLRIDVQENTVKNHSKHHNKDILRMKKLYFVLFAVSIMSKIDLNRIC